MYKKKTISYWLTVNCMQHMKIKDKVAYKVEIHGEGMSDKWEEFWCWRATASVSVHIRKMHSIPVLPSCQLCIM